MHGSTKVSVLTYMPDGQWRRNVGCSTAQLGGPSPPTPPNSGPIFRDHGTTMKGPHEETTEPLLRAHNKRPWNYYSRDHGTTVRAVTYTLNPTPLSHKLKPVSEVQDSRVRV